MKATAKPGRKVGDAQIWTVKVVEGADEYTVRLSTYPANGHERGAVLLLGTRTKTGRTPAPDRRGQIERAAIEAVPL